MACSAIRARIVAVSSLAKAFGAPVAVVAGSARLIRRYESWSDTRVHCSPPTVAVLEAAERALAINETEGDTRRLLSRNWFGDSSSMRSGGIGVESGLFPIQTIEIDRPDRSRGLHVACWKPESSGIRGAESSGEGPRLSFIVTAAHSWLMWSVLRGPDRYSPEIRAEKGDECTRN